MRKNDSECVVDVHMMFWVIVLLMHAHFEGLHNESLRLIAKSPAQGCQTKAMSPQIIKV